MKRFISTIMIASLFFGQTAVAAEPPRLCPECIIYRIKKDKVAPEDGWLYTDLSQATLMANQEAREKEMQNEFDFKLKMQAIDLKYATATTAIALDALKRENREVDKIKDGQINFLEDQLVEANKKSDGTDRMLWFSIGVGGGILIGVLSAWAYSMVAKSQSN